MEPDVAERALPTFSRAERDRRWGRVLRGRLLRLARRSTRPVTAGAPLGRSPRHRAHLAHDGHDRSRVLQTVLGPRRHGTNSPRAGDITHTAAELTAGDLGRIRRTRPQESTAARPRRRIPRLRRSHAPARRSRSRRVGARAVAGEAPSRASRRYPFTRTHRMCRIGGRAIPRGKTAKAKG